MKKEEFQRLARTQLKYFIAYVAPWYSFQPHHLLIIDKLQELIDGVNFNLMISLPPRAGKSQLCSRFLPAMLLGMSNTCQDPIMLGSFDKGLAGKFGKDVKEIMKTEAYSELFPDVDLIGRADIGNEFSTTLGGSFFGTGVNANTTGRDATWLIGDDTISGLKEASKKSNLVKVHEWWTGTFEARETVGKTGNSPRKLILSTRWADLDLIGWLQSIEPDQWEYLNITALCDDEENDLLGRKLGESLWEDNPALQSDKLKRKQARDPVVFSKVFMGEPVAATGNFFNTEAINYYTSPITNRASIYCAWSTPNFTDQDEVHCCLTVWQRVKGNSVYLIDYRRMVINSRELFEKSLHFATFYNANYTVFDSNDFGTTTHSLSRKQARRCRPVRVRDGVHQCVNKARLALESPKVQLIPDDLIQRQINSYPHGAEDDIVRSICTFLAWYSTAVYMGDFSLSGEGNTNVIGSAKSKRPHYFGVESKKNVSDRIRF